MPELYRKKSVTIEAVRWTGDNVAELTAFAGAYFDVIRPEDRAEDPDKTAQVYDILHNTWVGVYDNQWVICGVKGEYYPCDPAAFEETYEKVTDGG